MKDLLSRLQALDPATYQLAHGRFALLTKEEGQFTDPGWLRDAILQEVLQEAIAKRGHYIRLYMRPENDPALGGKAHATIVKARPRTWEESMHQGYEGTTEAEALLKEYVWLLENEATPCD